jgi:hypothetical protein
VVRVRMPGAVTAFPPVQPGHGSDISRTNGGAILGRIDNVIGIAGAANVIRIQLNATEGELADPAGTGPPSPTAPCPSGTWTLELSTKANANVVAFHAWIARDDLHRAFSPARQQSRFAPGQADPRYTIADLATGELTICVGAHNAETLETCGYSACGPTRDRRHKPDVTAPAEEDATARGTLCASSRRAQPTWFNGTSAAAPQVAGVVALMLQYNRDRGKPPLTSARIHALLAAGAVKGMLVGNRRQDIDPRCPAGKRQSNHLAALSGSGKVDITRSMP